MGHGNNNSTFSRVLFSTQSKRFVSKQMCIFHPINVNNLHTYALYLHITSVYLLWELRVPPVKSLGENVNPREED